MIWRALTELTNGVSPRHLQDLWHLLLVRSTVAFREDIKHASLI